MGVFDGQPVNQTITNPAFINKNVDDIMPNQLGFNRPMSGPSIADIQQAVNDLYTATGVSETQNGTNYNATPGTITNGDTYLVALTKLANKFDSATGHLHTGAPGDGPELNVVRSLVTAATGLSPIFGDLTLTAGANMTIAQSATGFTFTASTATPTTIAASGNPDLGGEVILIAGSGVTLSQSGQNITIDSSGGSSFTLAASGNSALTGNVVLVAGGGVSLTQTGQDITISASGGGGSSLVVQTETSNYTALETDDVILCSGSAFSVTLPAASAGTKLLRIEKTDSPFANIITIAAAGSDTVQALASTTLNTQYESVELISDGVSNWAILNRQYPTNYQTYSLAIGGGATFGTIALNIAKWKRIGNAIELIFNWLQTSAASVNGSGPYYFPIPTGLVIDTSLQPVASSITQPFACGQFRMGWPGGSGYDIIGYVYPSDTATLQADCTYFQENVTGQGYSNIDYETFPASQAGATGIYFKAELPIVGWN